MNPAATAKQKMWWCAGALSTGEFIEESCNTRKRGLTSDGKGATQRWTK